MSFGLRISSSESTLELSDLDAPLAQIAEYRAYSGTSPTLVIPGLSQLVAEGKAVVTAYVPGSGRRAQAATPSEANNNLFIAVDTIRGPTTSFVNYLLVIYV